MSKRYVEVANKITWPHPLRYFLIGSPNKNVSDYFTDIRKKRIWWAGGGKGLKSFIKKIYSLFVLFYLFFIIKIFLYRI